MIDVVDVASRMYFAKANSKIISELDRATDRILGLESQAAVPSEKRDEQDTEEGRRKAEILKLKDEIAEYIEKHRANTDEDIASEANGVRTGPSKEQATFQTNPPSSEPNQTNESDHSQDNGGDGTATPPKTNPTVFNAQGEQPTVQSPIDQGPEEPASETSNLQVIPQQQVTEETNLMNQEGDRDTIGAVSTQESMSPLPATKIEGEARELTAAEGAKAPPLEPQDTRQILEGETNPNNEPTRTQADTPTKDPPELQKPVLTVSSIVHEEQNREHHDSTEKSPLAERMLIGQKITCHRQQEVDDNRSTGEEGAERDSDDLLLPIILIGPVAFCVGAWVYNWWRRRSNPPTLTQNGGSDPSNPSPLRERRSPMDSRIF
jgi:hypothetical protein